MLGSEEEGLYYELLHPNKPKRKLEILPSVYTLGSFYRKRLDDNEFLALERYFGHAPVTAEVNAFNHIEMNGHRFMVWIIKECFEGTVQLYNIVLITLAILPRLSVSFSHV